MCSLMVGSVNDNFDASNMSNSLADEVSLQNVFTRRDFRRRVDLDRDVVALVVAGRKGTRARNGMLFEEGRTVARTRQHRANVRVRAAAEVVHAWDLHFEWTHLLNELQRHLSYSNHNYHHKLNIYNRFSFLTVNGLLTFTLNVASPLNVMFPGSLTGSGVTLKLLMRNGSLSGP